MIPESPLQLGRWFNSSVLALAMLVVLTGSGNSTESYDPPDCGMNSLYILLKLNGTQVNLEDLRGILPPRRNGGYSLMELQGAAGRCGHNLSGVRLTRDNVPLDRPVIAHFGAEHEGIGHYAVLAPVGETGTMVQIIDPPYHPKIIDYASIIPPGSSIKILYPLRFRETRSFLVLGIGVALVAVAVALVVGRGRGSWGTATIRDKLGRGLLKGFSADHRENDQSRIIG
jgi:hypothetical protein